MLSDYEKMSTTELESLLKSLLEKLDDIEAVRHSTLGQTGHHVPGSAVKRFEKELKGINEKITIVKSILEKRAQ